MISFSLLGSGSSGNALLVQAGDARILIDSGLSFKQSEIRAAALGLGLRDLDAVFVTHEHGDHVRGLGTLARKTGAPVYLTRGTCEGLPKSVGRLPNVHCFEAGACIGVKGAQVTSFSISHDAADPVSYTVEAEGVKIGMAADLGMTTALVKSRLRGAHGLILEANHCPDMLRMGPYPPAIQQRIRGRNGHLSNESMASLLRHVSHPKLRRVVLVHLSAENNDRDLALRAAREALAGVPAEVAIAAAERPTPWFEVAP